MSCEQKIDSGSAPAFTSALGIFTIPPTNVAINRTFFRDILPLNTISQESPYLFRLLNDNLWIDLAHIYLFLELCIEKLNAAGVWVPIELADDEIGGVQGIGHAFVRQLKVSLGTTEIYDSGTLYPYKTCMANELSYNWNAKNFFLETAGYHNSVKQNDTTDVGFQARCRAFRAGRRCQFLSRLDFDLSNQELLMVNNIDLLFTIYRSRDSFLLHNLKANDTDTYRMAVHSVKLYVKMVDVRPSLNLSIYQALEKQPAKYAVRKTEIKSCFLTGGRTEVDHNIFSSTIPRRLTIGMVDSKAFNGDIRLSPFNFKPFALRELRVEAGGFNYPATPYNLNFDHSGTGYSRAYVDMFEALGRANSSEAACDISMHKFFSGWTFFVIPLTSTLDDSCGFELLRSGTTSIHLEFDQPLPADGVELIVLGEFDQMVMIDFHRRVICDNKLG
jgi:hypothetical protein